MPNYNFRSKTTGAVETLTMKIAEMEAHLRDNPDLEIALTNAPAYGDPVAYGRVQPDGKFKDLVKQIKKNNPRNTIDGSWV